MDDCCRASWTNLYYSWSSLQCHNGCSTFCISLRMCSLNTVQSTHRFLLNVFPAFSSRPWSASWLWSVNVTASAGRAAYGPAGWPWRTSDAPATTYGSGTTARCRSPLTSTALGSPRHTRTSSGPARTTWCTLRTRQTTAYGTMSQVNSPSFSLGLTTGSGEIITLLNNRITIPVTWNEAF